MSAPAGADQPLVRDGGLPDAGFAADRDPFEALDDLMTVVEAPCPVWPRRGAVADSSSFLLRPLKQATPALPAFRQDPTASSPVWLELPR